MPERKPTEATETFVYSRSDEPKIIELLGSDASRKEKADALRELGHLSTEASVTTLAGLLADEELSHMARYAMESLNEASVDVAFREALGNLKGKPLVGVIGSVGVRRDAEALGVLAKLLKDSDPDVRQMAARAIGNIGTVDAANVLKGALPDADTAMKVSLYEGLLECAENLAASGWTGEAKGIYDLLGGDDAPKQVKAASKVGLACLSGQA